MRTRVNQLLARVPRRSGGEGLFEVPRLEELVADPDKVRVLDAHTTRALRKQAIVALNVLFDHELVRDRLGMDRFGPRRDRLLNVEEAATKVRYESIGFIVITNICPSQCGTAGHFAFRNWELKSTSRNGAVEKH